MHDEQAELGDLRITDDGVGLPPGANLATAQSTGLFLVRVLTQQLKGTVEASGDGTSIRILVPLSGN
jgi:two-component sensor histidine kinase